MSFGLSALIYVWFAHGVAFLLMPTFLPFALRVRAVGFWACTAALLFLVPDTLIVLLTAGALLAFITPIRGSARAAFFLIAAPAAPYFMFAPVPFPGIQSLIALSNHKACVLVLLAPLLFMAREGDRRPRFGLPDLCLIIYALYTAISVGLWLDNSTVGLRFLFDQVIGLVLPYIVIRSAVRNLKDVEAFFKALLTLAIILAAVALVSTVKKWDMYFWLQPPSAITMPDMRSGFLRINATLSTHALSYNLAAALIILEFLRKQHPISWIRLNLLRILFLFGMVVTDSRGSFLGAVTASATYFVLTTKNRFFRVGLLIGAAFGVFAVGIWLLQADFTNVKNDTFSYRQDLFFTAIKFVAENPFFGNYDFYNTGFFDHLIQGQQIIDITNLYLQVALHFGLIGLALFLVVVFTPALRLTFASLRLRPPSEQKRSRSRLSNGGSTGVVDPMVIDRVMWWRASSAMISVVAGWAVLVATTSDVGLTVHFGIVFAALCHATIQIRPTAADIPADAAKDLAAAIAVSRQPTPSMR